MSETAPRQVDTAKLARDILDRTATAGTEEDLKMRVEPLLRRAFHDIGVDVNIVAYERATALSSKRMDAVYGYVVIEYKGPGKLATPALAQDAERQVRTYLEEEAHRHGRHAEAFSDKAAFTLPKGAPTRYPVEVVEWRRKPGVGRLAPEWPLDKVMAHTEHSRIHAIPVDPDSRVSAWQTAKRSELKLSARLKGPNPYPAHLGARVGPYGVFWLRLKEVRPDGLLVIEPARPRQADHPAQSLLPPPMPVVPKASPMLPRPRQMPLL